MREKALHYQQKFVVLYDYTLIHTHIRDSKMKVKLIIFATLMAICGTSAAQEKTALTVTEMKNLTKLSEGSTVSVHDPSVVYNKSDNYFYIVGSHMGLGKSKDLVSWESVDNGIWVTMPNWWDNYQDGSKLFNKPFWEAFKECPEHEVKLANGNTGTLGSFDAAAFCSWYSVNGDSAWVKGNMWAPDVIWNESMQKWCMYMSLNGLRWNSVIVLLTASKPTGPFTYQGPVVMGGFSGGKHANSNGTQISAPSYKMTDLELVWGTQASLPSDYAKGGDWGWWWPNCIDPCPFYDETGELWLVYGSWSGGIFILKLDKETGLRDYTYTYESDVSTKGQSYTSDKYFGKRIAGGYYVSGEGPYVQHIGNYYYLFVSYGGYAPGGYDDDGNPQGGYEMRIFRSKNPDGPYVDAAGTAATYTSYMMNYGSNSATNRGVKLLDAYNGWGLQEVGERSQGHNSACQDDKGRSLVVYHTKFNDGTSGHQVRVHQLFLNEKEWLVASPFCYKGEEWTDETIASTSIPVEDIVGDYHFLLHPYKQNFAEFEEQTPSIITLNADGTIKGAKTGTWSVKEGSLYITLKLGTTSYYGVIMESTVDGATAAGFQTSGMKALSFSAVANNGVPIWGYKLQPQYAVAYNYVSNSINVKNSTSYSRNISLMFPTTDNTTLTWTSSEPDVISETGKYNPREENTPVTLTGRLECGNYYWEQTYNITARAASTPNGDYQTGLLAYYNMDDTPCYNAYDGTQRAYFMRAGSGTTSTQVSDYDRFGKVAHLNFGDQKNCSYVRMSNPLYGKENLEGFTVAMWVKRTDDNAWDALWSFFNSTSSTASSPRFFLTGNGYLGYNDNASETTWFDINHPDTKTYNDITVGEWAWVTITVGPTKGIQYYVNRSNKLHNVASSNNVTSTTKVKDLPIAKLVSDVTKMKYFNLGMGSFWGSPDCYIDDVMIFNREMTSTDLLALETMVNRVTDLTSLETAIGEVVMPQHQMQNGVFDLQGRRVTNPTRGLYIINGKKILVK